LGEIASGQDFKGRVWRALRYDWCRIDDLISTVRGTLVMVGPTGPRSPPPNGQSSWLGLRGKVDFRED
jgi:hypothetical protein